MKVDHIPKGPEPPHCGGNQRAVFDDVSKVAYEILVVHGVYVVYTFRIPHRLARHIDRRYVLLRKEMPRDWLLRSSRMGHWAASPLFSLSLSGC